MAVSQIGSTTTAYQLSTTSVSSTTPSSSTTATSNTNASTTVGVTTSSTTVNYSSATASTTCSTTISYGGASTTASVSSTTSSTTAVSSTTATSSTTAIASTTPSECPIRDTEYKDYFSFAGTYGSEYEKNYYINPAMHNKLEELYYKDVNFTGSVDLGKVSSEYAVPAGWMKLSYSASAEINVGNEEAFRSISTDISKAINVIGECIEENKLATLDKFDLSVGYDLPGVTIEADTSGGAIIFKMPDGMTELTFRRCGVNGMEISIVHNIENEDYGSLQVEMTLSYDFYEKEKSNEEEVYVEKEVFANEWEKHKDELSAGALVLGISLALVSVVLTHGTSAPLAVQGVACLLALLEANDNNAQENENSNEIIN